MEDYTKSEFHRASRTAGLLIKGWEDGDFGSKPQIFIIFKLYIYIYIYIYINRNTSRSILNALNKGWSVVCQNSS